MNQFFVQKGMVETLSRCQKEFEKNLKNKKIMFIYENKNRSIDKEEMLFPISCFYHLTGIKAFDKDNKPLNSYSFYNLLKTNRIDEMKLKFKDTTTYYKLEILPQLMRIDRTAKMIGDFCGNNVYLQTSKVTGNINACMGFIKDNEYSNVYVPNTALKEDIRKVVDNKAKIIAILKKDMTNNLYANITYLKQDYEIKDILKNQEITKNIDVNNIYSADRIVDKKIYEYYYELENNNERNIEDLDITDNF